MWWVEDSDGRLWGINEDKEVEFTKDRNNVWRRCSVKRGDKKRVRGCTGDLYVEVLVKDDVHAMKVTKKQALEIVSQAGMGLHDLGAGDLLVSYWATEEV